MRPKPRGYWCEENVLASAAPYNTVRDFRSAEPSAYSIAKKNGWLPQVTAHMTPLRKPDGYWSENKERCRSEALKYKTRSDFNIYSKSAYLACYMNGWLDEVCSHMVVREQVPQGYYTKEILAGIASRYETRWEFQQRDRGAYLAAYSRGILDEICQHMRVDGSRKKRCIYEIVDHARCVAYIGLTYNIQARRAGHATNKKIVETFGYDFEMTQITDFLTVEDAIVAEANFIEAYRLKGYTILNKTKAGALGGNIEKWTKDRVREVARQASSRKEFQKIANGAYQAALRNNWMDEICSHMVPKQKPSGYWNNKEVTLNEALKYSKMKDFEKNSGSAYNACRRNNWLDEVREVMLKRASC